MSSYTVAQLKTAVANIPAGANAWTIEVPAGLMLPVCDSRSVAADGTLFIHVRGYFNLDTHSWEPAG
jgi:hypothetical protein